MSTAPRFVLCPACRRHAKAHEAACPFCATTLAGERAVGAPLDPKLSRSRYARTTAALLASASAALLLDCQTTMMPPYGNPCPPEPNCGGEVAREAGAAATDASAKDGASEADAQSGDTDATSDASTEGDAGDTSEAGDAATD
jgi:hypothetical protein